MPFIIVKMWKGRENKEKEKLIRELTRATVDSINCPPQSVQIAIEELERENWGISGKPASEIS